MTITELKRIRTILRLSRAGLAAQLGVTTNTVSRWEMGLHPIPRWARLLLSKYLDAPSPILHTMEIPVIPAIRGCRGKASRPKKSSSTHTQSPRTSS